MPVEDEMGSGPMRGERADHVGPFGLCRSVGCGHPLGGERIVQEGCRRARIAGWIGARQAHETRKKADELLPILIDPSQDRLARAGHLLLLSLEAPGQGETRRKHSREPCDADDHPMTYSLAGRCARTGMLGSIVTISSIAVGNRCQFARVGVGAVLTQHRTDPRLGPLGLSFSSSASAPKKRSTHWRRRRLTMVGVSWQ